MRSRAPTRPFPRWPERSCSGRSERFSNRALRSAEAGRFQVVVRLNDLDQPILGRAIAAIGVGMKLLHQFLEAHLHLVRGGADVEPEPIERLAFGVADRRGGLRARLLLAAQAFAEQAERIAAAADAAKIRPRMRLAGSHLPGRAVAGNGVLLIGHHRGVVHALEEIVRLIVLPHVLETEAPVILLVLASLGRAVTGLLLAARPLASRPAGFRPAILARFDADAIKKRRVEFHDQSLCAFAHATFKT